MTRMTHTLAEFLAVETDVRFRWFRRNEVDREELRGYLGDDEFERYADIVAGAPEHLSGPLTNVIFVPGAMGSLLHSEALGGVWWLDTLHPARIAELRLAHDGNTDFIADHAIRPFGVDISYDPFRKAIIADDRFRHRAYPYDWRKSVRLSAAGLRDLIDQTHATNGGAPIHLVAHSMGGLIIRAMLAWYADEATWAKIGRIAFIGTPHFGSPAIAGYLKNHLWGWEQLAVLGFFLTRETFRSMRGVIGLLPAPADVYPNPDLSAADRSPLDYDHPCSNFDLYDVDEWQLGLATDDERHLQLVLDECADTHRALAHAHRRLTPEQRERMLSVAGVGYRALFRIERTDDAFSWRQSRREYSRIAAHPHRDGDGRVTLASAGLPSVKTEYIRGVHDELHNLAAVQTTVLSWLYGDDESLLAESAEAACAQSHLGSNGSSGAIDDPGWWNEEEDPERLRALLERVEQGLAPDFRRVHIL